MASFEQLQAASMGRAFVGTTATTPGAQTIIVQNQGTSDGGCLDCDDQNACAVSPTQATALDFNRFQTANGSIVRFTWVNGATTALKLNFLGGYGISEHDDYDDNFRAFLGAPTTYVNFNNTSGATINGQTFARPVSSFNYIVGSTGLIVPQITLRVDGTVPANVTTLNNGIIGFRLPIDAHNAVETSFSYDPFCDACFTNNVGTAITHRYRGTFLEDMRHGFQFLMEAGSSGTIELCIASIGIGSHDQAPAASQW